MMLLPMMANADAVEIDGIYYNLVVRTKQAEVTNNPNKYFGEVVIPESVIYDGTNYSVTSIGDYAFDGCELQEVISMNENPFDINIETFSNNTFYNATLCVPVGTIEKYRAAEGWKAFSNIVERDVPNGIQNVKTGNEEQMASYKEIYDLNGRHISELQRGLNIVRMSDGTTKQVVIK